MQNETATATNSNEATPSTEAPATLLAQADSEASRQTQTTETPAATATETPATATETTEKPAAEAATKPATQAPEKYDIKAPEGTEYDPKVLEAFTSAAREADLTQDAAQKLIEKMAPALAARQNDQIQAIHNEWIEASTADKEIGGEKLRENLEVVSRAINTYGTPELRTLLNTTGLGSNPEVLRLLFRVGKTVSEDSHVGGRPGATGAAASGAASFYPNSNMT